MRDDVLRGEVHKNKNNKTKIVTRSSATAKQHRELRCECEGFRRNKCKTRNDVGGCLDDVGTKIRRRRIKRVCAASYNEARSNLTKSVGKTTKLRAHATGMN